MPGLVALHIYRDLNLCSVNIADTTHATARDTAQKCWPNVFVKKKTPQKANKHIWKKVELFHEGFIDQQHTQSLQPALTGLTEMSWPLRFQCTCV